MNNWLIAECDGKENIKAMLDFLLPRFIEIFGAETMGAEVCFVFNDINADCPMLITSADPPCIRLAQKEVKAWAQTIYQLSHEMCHYAIRQHKQDKEFSLKWFEEIICEAVSLYFLQYAAMNWKDCRLSIGDPMYAKAIATYLNNCLSKLTTDSFQKCDTAEKLKLNESVMEEDRAGHWEERNRIYKAISDAPLDLKVACEYPKYLKDDGITIDFDQWIQDYDCRLLRVFKEIMPVKKDEEGDHTNVEVL